jgi:hypothetical protein
MAFENQAKLYCRQIARTVRIVDSQANCLQITRSTFHSVFVMPNGAIRIKIPPFDSALEIVLITDVKCTVLLNSILANMAFVFESQAKLYCCMSVDKSLKIIKLIIKKCSMFDP